MRNRKVYDGDVGNVATPESAGDVKQTLAEAVASTLGYLGMSLPRMREMRNPAFGSPC
jgi:hypothetical protein